MDKKKLKEITWKSRSLKYKWRIALKFGKREKIYLRVEM